MTSAPPRFLGRRYRGGNEGERGGNIESAAEIGKTRRSSELTPISLIVFPANAGTQGPPSTGWQPKGHQATTASVARRVLRFHEHPNIVPAEYFAALSSAPWQRHHRGPCAPAFAGETTGHAAK